MNADLIPFAFENSLIRAVWRGAEPWFVGRDLCQALEIRNENDALASLDDDEREAGVGISDPSGTKYAIIVSEPGVYRLVFRSRKPTAERFKRWLAHEVLPALRKSGRYEACGAPQDRPEAAESEGLIHRLNVVREARILFGTERARSLWRQLGLPAVPPPPATAKDEALACLRHILDGQPQEGAPRLRDMLANALQDEEDARLALITCGIRALPERDAFVVANRHPQLDILLKGSAWAGSLVAMRVLRRLPGAEACGPFRWAGQKHQMVVRGTLLPGDLLDELP
jgi:prophage antirepressor-like protein